MVRTADGKIVRSNQDVAIGDNIEIIPATGKIISRSRRLDRSYHHQTGRHEQRWRIGRHLPNPARTDLLRRLGRKGGRFATVFGRVLYRGAYRRRGVKNQPKSSVFSSVERHKTKATHSIPIKHKKSVYNPAKSSVIRNKACSRRQRFSVCKRSYGSVFASSVVVASNTFEQ